MASSVTASGGNSFTTGGGANWDDIPTSEHNLVADLLSQWGAISGYTWGPSDQVLHDMARRGINSIRDFAVFMWNDPSAGMPMEVKRAQPWLGVGMNADTWHSTIAQWQDQLYKLTGQRADLSTLGFSSTGPSDPNAWMWYALQNGESAGTFADDFMHDATMQKNYGWLKFGYNYEQFQQYKVGARLSFGHELDDPQALAQLQYMHAASGGQYQARASTQGAAQKGVAGYTRSVNR